MAHRIQTVPTMCQTTRPLDHPTFLAGTVDSVVEYLLSEVSAKRVLESLYTGISCASVDPDRGVAAFTVGSQTVTMSYSLLDASRVELNRPISKIETLSIGKAVCRRATWPVCLDFIWLRKRLPIYNQLFDSAKDDMRGPATCWVFTHALSILQTAAHAVVRSTFLALLERATQTRLQRLLEDLLAKPWELNEDQADRLFQCTQPFSLFPVVPKTRPPKKSCHLWISDTVAVVYSLRERCFLSILCTGHANLIWPTCPPQIFSEINNAF